MPTDDAVFSVAVSQAQKPASSVNPNSLDQDNYSVGIQDIASPLKDGLIDPLTYNANVMEQLSVVRRFQPFATGYRTDVVPAAPFLCQLIVLVMSCAS